MPKRNEPLDALVAELRALGAEQPTRERRAILRAALLHKREGVQSVAAQVIGAWGGRESVEDLRVWLERLIERHDPYIGPRTVAIRELARCIAADDSDWALDLYFGQKGVVATHEYLPLASATDPATARPRIERELRSLNAVKRHAALKLTSRMKLPDSASLARPLINDPDDWTRRLARDLANQA
jgi:hypothetical protein